MRALRSSLLTDKPDIGEISQPLAPLFTKVDTSINLAELVSLWFHGAAMKAGGMERTRGFARLFMVPGMDHCGLNTEGPGIADTGIDPLGALEAWVERGMPPDSLLATKTDPAGQVVWRRPVCAYPEVARHVGGDPKDPSGFRCRGPQAD